MRLVKMTNNGYNPTHQLLGNKTFFSYIICLITKLNKTYFLLLWLYLTYKIKQKLVKFLMC